MTAREALLRWARKSTARYPGVRVNDFTSSWRDGLAFTAIIHRNRPDLIDWREARQRRTRERLETAFHVVDKEYGVTRLLDPQGKHDARFSEIFNRPLFDMFRSPPHAQQSMRIADLCKVESLSTSLKTKPTQKKLLWMSLLIEP